MIHIREAVIVEGKYDKIKLSSFLDGIIIETRGFGIFRNREQMELIRRLADARGLVVLTDSDGAGFVIRNHLSGAIAPKKIKHAYIPDIFGKEKRKERPSREGKLGVEGVPISVILDALRRAGATLEGEGTFTAHNREKIKKSDLYEAGLSGGPGATQKRALLLGRLHLPEHLTTNAMLSVLNSFMDRAEFLSYMQEFLYSPEAEE